MRKSLWPKVSYVLAFRNRLPGPFSVCLPPSQGTGNPEPKLIVILSGIAYLVWGMFEKHPLLKRNRLISGAIFLSVGIVVYFLFRRP